eukprot:TRINITY_DN6091_c0_g1_i1.p2 TRINITY_DN6091_c0_g1~~TRINITY_DN6091_c0_g1_i1.p2  ORF type:complete len:124 (+),score=7.04 TRINITY_DN6091_c0_g1_i1:911-1282(+)
MCKERGQVTRTEQDLELLRYKNAVFTSSQLDFEPVWCIRHHHSLRISTTTVTVSAFKKAHAAASGASYNFDQSWNSRRTSAVSHDLLFVHGSRPYLRRTCMVSHSCMLVKQCREGSLPSSTCT